MRVGDGILKCVCFIGWTDPTKDLNERETIEGTGWFTAVTESHWLIVTARHVVETAVPQDRKTTVFLNQKDGLFTLDFDHDDWEYHEDTSVDIAVLRVPFDVGDDGDSRDLDHHALDPENFASDRTLADPYHPIGIGNPLYFPGLFSHHPGKNRALPIVREGTIAAMNIEPVTIGAGESSMEIDVYLAEVRSIGGLSGSPVLAYFSRESLNPEAPNDRALWPDWTSDVVFGVVHGHFDLVVPQTATNEFERLNTGICMVVPIKYVVEVLNQKRVLEVTRRLEESLE